MSLKRFCLRAKYSIQFSYSHHKMETNRIPLKNVLRNLVYTSKEFFFLKWFINFLFYTELTTHKFFAKIPFFLISGIYVWITTSKNSYKKINQYFKINRCIKAFEEDLLIFEDSLLSVLFLIIIIINSKGVFKGNSYRFCSKLIYSLSSNILYKNNHNWN